jgi:hypothetical protein
MRHYPRAALDVKRDDVLTTGGEPTPRPLERISYIDFATVWLKEMPPRSERDWVETQCGGKGQDGARRQAFDVRQEPAKWDRAYQVRLQLRQPSHLALQWLATLPDAVLNYLEIALDWIFASARERDEAHALISKHHLKRWHGSQQITFDQQTRYTARRQTAGQRRVANLLTNYPDRACRITAEDCCEHGEWRLNGQQALRRAGLIVGGLKDLDHRAFWRDRLLLRRRSTWQLWVVSTTNGSTGGCWATEDADHGTAGLAAC